MGIDAWNTFVLVKSLYVVRKSEKSLDMAFDVVKTTVMNCSSKTKVHVLALVWQTTLENCTKALNKGCSAQNQMISLAIASSDCRVHTMLSWSILYTKFLC